MNLDADLALVPYDQAKHWRWVRAPVMDLAGSRYHPDRTRRSLEAQLRQEIALGFAHVIVSKADPDTLVACAVWRKTAVVWCFVRPGCRHRGVMRYLLRSWLADGPFGVVLWTHMAEKLSRKHGTCFPL